MGGPDRDDRAAPGRNDVLRVFQTRRQTRAFYDKIAGVYDLLAERSEQPVRAAALERLALGAAERALEIGPGTGSSLLALARAAGPAGRIAGLDLSERMLRQSRARLKARDDAPRAPVALVCGDGMRLPFAGASFDAAFMSFTLELFDTPEIPVVLAECRRVLRDGGRLVVAAISKEGGHDPLRRVFEWAHLHFPNLIDCRPIRARRELERAGFTVDHAELMHMWVPVEIVRGR